MISRAAVSFIIRTGGAERPFRHERHFSFSALSSAALSESPADGP
jgi:hypothetical protein